MVSVFHGGDQLRRDIKFIIWDESYCESTFTYYCIETILCCESSSMFVDRDHLLSDLLLCEALYLSSFDK